MIEVYGLQRLKIITSHSGLARFLAETSEQPVGYVAREHVKAVPSPYRYSPTQGVYDWHGKQIMWFETAHRRYEVFAVPPSMPITTTEE